MATLELTDQLHRYSAEEYERLATLDLFGDQRVELIDGLILDMTPVSPAHENAIEWLSNEWLHPAIDPRQHHLRVCMAMRIGERSEPVPDLAVVEAIRPRDTHPTHAQLVIEVAHSSRVRDLRVKPALYAGAVDEYWVIELDRRQVIVHRDGSGGSYLDVGVIPAGEHVMPGSLPLAALDSGALFADVVG